MPPAARILTAWAALFTACLKRPFTGSSVRFRSPPCRRSTDSVSEWLLFQAVLAGPGFPEPVLRFLSPVVGAMLARPPGWQRRASCAPSGRFSWGVPRSKEAAEAHEVPLVQSVAIGILAVLCILGGLFGGFSAWAIGPLLKRLQEPTLQASQTGRPQFRSSRSIRNAASTTRLRLRFSCCSPRLRRCSWCISSRTVAHAVRLHGTAVFPMRRQPLSIPLRVSASRYAVFIRASCLGCGGSGDAAAGRSEARALRCALSGTTLGGPLCRTRPAP